MKIILLKDVLNVGKRGDVKDVSDGYARNFLIPNNLAKLATSSGIAERDKELSEKKAKEAAETEKFGGFEKQTREKTAGVLRLSKKADEKGNLYAAISAEDVAHALRGLKIAHIPENIQELISFTEHIKVIGTHEVKVTGSGGASFTLRLEVTADAKKEEAKHKKAETKKTAKK
ncbi:50S ribosomal protein L9 [Candidatus Giovannonibacteria bacterium]|nr:50S ribosomal protein L9 [Candidatus Giovannonibacteria bacterium]